MHRSRSLLIYIAAFSLIGGCAVTQPAPGEPGPPPVTKKFSKAEDLAFLRLRPAAAGARRGRIIFIGVYGGEIPQWDKARYFIPTEWPSYQNLRDEADLSRIAYHDTLMHVLALEIARRFPDAITLMIKGDTEVVADAARYLYAPGDKLFIIGHSQGGAVVAEAAHALKKARIPVAMLAEMEGFLAYEIVPDNVVQAFNFYVPTRIALCPGRVELKAEAPEKTRVANIPVPDPWGPFSGLCAAHRNIDSDPRVWKPLLQYMIDAAGS